MTITGALVLYAVAWFMTLFVVTPIGMTTQGDKGEVVPGTPASAPEGFPFKRKFIITTIAATIIWAVIFTIIVTGAITVHDFDWFNQMDGMAIGE